MRLPVLILYCLLTAQFSIAQGEYKLPSSPEKEYYRHRLAEQIAMQLDKIDWAHTERITSGTALYTIPVVVHVLHKYGTDLVADNTIYPIIDGINDYFLKTIADTTGIIDKFKLVAANTQISFRLATKDPNGNPTKGIEHIYTYLAYPNSSFPDQSKMNQWPQEKYLNIWLMDNYTSGSTFLYGYSYNPLDAAYDPYYDGIILSYQVFESQALAREAAKYLNLVDPCGYTSACVDNDGIADTPPCLTDFSNHCSSLYDTICDTPNWQNIMAGTYVCNFMFTYGQGQYMQYILNIDIGNRDSLITPYNFSATGMDAAMPDMMPVADFSVGSSLAPAVQSSSGFYCEGQNVVFTNHSWNDTITSVLWTFSNNASTPSSTSLTSVLNHFHQPGWVTVSLAATGNNTGTTTLADSQSVYIADSVAINANGYAQEFSDTDAMAKWPIFNYYKNDFKWQRANAGYYDNSCLEYTAFDNRPFPANMTGTPQGDMDDVFTPGFDLAYFGSTCYLNFMSSGATRALKNKFMTDTLEIDYSINNTGSWVKLKTLYGNSLCNKGMITTAYTPSSMSDWVPQAILLPAQAITPYTLFRFRYHPGADSTGMSSGNNFYMDDVTFNAFPVSEKIIGSMPDGVSLQPNPTQGSTVVTIKESTGISAVTVAVADITGRVIYKTIESNSGNILRTTLPGNIFMSKGLYLVHVTTDKIDKTEKLVVY